MTKRLYEHGDPNVNPKGIICLPLPEQACIQLVTGPLPYQYCGKAYSSPPCELGYRFLPWNPKMYNIVGCADGDQTHVCSFSGPACGACILCRNRGICHVGTGDLSYSETVECVFYTGTEDCIIYREWIVSHIQGLDSVSLQVFGDVSYAE